MSDNISTQNSNTPARPDEHPPQAMAAASTQENVRPTKVPLTRRQKAKRACLRNLCLVVLAVTGLNAALTSAMIAWQTPDLVAFDMKSTVDRFTEQATEKAVDDDELKLMTSRFTFSLNRALESWQQEHNAMILVKPAVISGMPDITDEIQADIGRRMLERP